MGRKIILELRYFPAASMGSGRMQEYLDQATKPLREAEFQEVKNEAKLMQRNVASASMSCPSASTRHGGYIVVTRS
jgi:hypothetical protein